MNITGAFALILGALFSAYVFMPKRRVLDYSLDAGQPGDQFLFNLFIAPVAIAVNFVASLPGALRALLARRHQQPRAGHPAHRARGLHPERTDSLNRFGSTDFYQLGKLLGVVLLLAGFLVSTETFVDLRVPFTRIVLRGARHERVENPPGDVIPSGRGMTLPTALIGISKGLPVLLAQAPRGTFRAS